MGSEYGLTKTTKQLWGKLSFPGSEYWLPLYVHMSDTGQVAALLWKHWVPTHTKKLIMHDLSPEAELLRNSEDYAKKVFMFLAVAHDIGKASPVFQGKAKLNGFSYIWENIERTGLQCYTKHDKKARELTHALISQAILEKAGLKRCFADIIGGHHGKPVNAQENINHACIWSDITGIGHKRWQQVQEKLVKFALNESGLEKLPQGKLSITSQVLLSGLLIMADWLASGEGFPLLQYEDSVGLKIDSGERAEEAWEQIKLPEYREFSDFCPAEQIFQTRFGISSSRPIQNSAVEAALKATEPGIMVIEAPMGEGKTEAALAAAECLANKDGLSGVYFALPTQATSDGIFKRIESWIVSCIKMVCSLFSLLTAKRDLIKIMKESNYGPILLNMMI